MRSDIKPGGTFPDYELPDHSSIRRKLSELQGDDPLILTLARGHYCPKEHQHCPSASRSSTLLGSTPAFPHGVRRTSDPLRICWFANATNKRAISRRTSRTAADVSPTRVRTRKRRQGGKEVGDYLAARPVMR
jgi:hypothetical protein